MNEVSPRTHSPIGLEAQGLSNLRNVYWNLSTPGLYEEAVKRNEGIIAHLGPLVVRTGQFTGRSPNDKFIVERAARPTTRSGGARSTAPSRRIASTSCTGAWPRTCRARMSSCTTSGAAPIPTTGWRCASSPSMPGTTCSAATSSSSRTPEDLATFQPEFVIIDCPGFHAFPEVDHTNSDVFILVNFDKKMVLIGGTEYAGEMKKSAFTAMNYFLPFQEVMPMHCSANIGPKGDTALFFGLSGTGKTTLSADPTRARSSATTSTAGAKDGVFNFEGGCYAKVIRLSPEGEPEIYATTRRLRHGAGERRHRHQDAPAGPERRLADREHALGLSAVAHPQCAKRTAGAAIRRISSS